MRPVLLPAFFIVEISTQQQVKPSFFSFGFLAGYFYHIIESTGL